MASMHPVVKKTSTSRKRSAQACLSCRSRKVRCDVITHGLPCTNCELDDKSCRVVGPTPNLSHHSSRRYSPASPPHRGKPSNNLNGTRARPAAPSVPARQDPVGVQAPSGGSAQQNSKANEDLNGEDWFAHGDNIDCTVSPTIDWDFIGSSARTETDGDLPGDPASPEFGRLGGQSTLTNDVHSVLGQSKLSTEPDATVLYCHYTYLTVANLPKMPPQHVSFLDTQGCLRVPTRPTLDDFVEKYFKYIHPLLPLLNEGEFWDMYSRSSSSPASGNTISLLVFQALLFASCHLVTPRTIELLGFSSFRSARAALYRRTKLLYDMEIESAPLALAQAAILLMGWVPPENSITRPYRTWLSLAIQHARSINADRYYPVSSAVSSPAQWKSRHAHRRLWCCCIIMDRISPLCTRMSIQITHDHCEIQNCLALCQVDLEDEVYRSQVYDSATKRRLITLFSRFLELLVILTDVLSLTFPFEQSVMSKRRLEEANRLTVVKCDTALRVWYERVTAHFQLGDEDDDKADDSQKSIMLQINMVLIYYHTALIAFGHYKMLQVYTGNESADSGDRSRLLDRCCCELQDAAAESTRRFGLVTKHRLIRMLPISALACLAIPLALHVVSMRLSSISKELALFDSGELESPTTGQGTMNRQRLDVLTDAMKQFLVHYDGVELIKDAARHAADLAQADRPTAQKLGQPPATDWSQILAKQPAKYLRMTWTVDVCISKGRLPEEHDFPDWLSYQLSQAKLYEPGGQLQSASPNAEGTDLTFFSGTFHPGAGSHMDFMTSPDESDTTGRNHSKGDSSFDVLAEVAGELAILSGQDQRCQSREIDVAGSQRFPILDLDGMKWSFP